MNRLAHRVLRLASLSLALACAPTNAQAETPRELGDILHAASAVSSEELAKLASFLNAPYYVVVPQGQNVTLLEGSRVIRLGARFGEEPPRNKPLLREILWNAGPGFVNFRLNDADDHHALEPGAIIVVGNAYTMSDAELARQRKIAALHERTTGVADAGTCSVSCGPGFYACCDYGPAPGNQPTCVCRSRNHIVECDAGGEGATECTITQN